MRHLGDGYLLRRSITGWLGGGLSEYGPHGIGCRCWPGCPGRLTQGYDAFISYAHAADDGFAPVLQRGLQHLAKAWNRRRAMEVFRDESSLAVSPGLWRSITAALDASRWFILLASPGPPNRTGLAKKSSTGCPIRAQIICWSSSLMAPGPGTPAQVISAPHPLPRTRRFAEFSLPSPCISI